MMRLALPIIVLFVLSGCSGNQAIEDSKSESPTAENTTVEASDSVVSATQSEKTDDSPVIIDVRTQAEWDDGHLAQAVHIPNDQIADKIETVTDRKDVEIVLYCKSGGRAGRAQKVLEGLGYTNVKNIGGLEDAREQFGGDEK